ncbi:pheromone A receptor-domain-containing protein [Mycena alexandri]|uniref:Pheromone A receptor-domain-containing protein n=1 Tax=Mycena alexandri TaxID=1745969 RepID=A0AAD6WNP7_9AGAR|nr:pheromone A receptor-domain-containing protein [Mycena alexandri]KAJ7038687.1 pheromone A receptor-domain-containing protein [Mycena alexandri]
MASFLLFPSFAFTGLCLSLVPLYWQFEAWNVGTLWYIFWIVLSCLTQYFNSVVWAENALNSAPVWCEISIRVSMAVSVGLPAASLCINRRLCEIVHMPPASVVGEPQKRRAIIVDSFITGLSPALYVVLQLVSQRHRFNVLEDIGCTPDFYDALPTYFISYTAPVVLSFGSLVYCILSMCTMSASRVDFADVLSAHKNLTPARFIRLTGLASATLLLTMTLGLLNIAGNATAAALATQVSGDIAPFNFGVVSSIARSLWSASESHRVAVELTRWIAPACAFLLIGFLGFASEARVHYTRAFVAVSNAFWNTLARLGIVRPLAPIPNTTISPQPRKRAQHPFLRLGSTRSKKQAIGKPMRAISGTGSLADVAPPTTAESPQGEMLTTFSPPSATTLRSFVAVTPSPTEPNKYILPPYRGWHYFSNTDHREVEVIDNSVETKALPEIPRGRTLA